MKWIGWGCASGVQSAAVPSCRTTPICGTIQRDNESVTEECRMSETGRSTRALVLENTMSRSREVFRPRAEGTVKLFTCGPSVYRRPHIGNYRTFLFEDLLQRYLEYLGYRVERVINFTDVEDKAIAEA